jgi:predicted nucleic acid-binding protein
MGVSLLDKIPVGSTIVVDSAPIIYVLDGTNRALSIRYLPLFRAAEKGRIAIAVSTITIAEVMAGPMMHGNDLLGERYRQALSQAHNWRAVDLSVDIAALAARMRAKYRLKLADAIQLATAIDVGACALVTHDRDFSRISEMPIIGVFDRN